MVASANVTWPGAVSLPLSLAKIDIHRWTSVDRAYHQPRDGHADVPAVLESDDATKAAQYAGIVFTASLFRVVDVFCE